MKFKNYLFILFAVCLAIGCEDLKIRTAITRETGPFVI